MAPSMSTTVDDSPLSTEQVVVCSSPLFETGEAAPHQHQRRNEQEPEHQQQRDAIFDEIAAMLRQETSPDYRCCDYFAKAKEAAAAADDRRRRRSSSSPSSSETEDAGAGSYTPLEIDPSSRRKMVKWVRTICDYCDFAPCLSTATAASSLVDRYLSHASPSVLRRTLTKKRSYQLLFMSALQVAAKVHEREELDGELLSELSRGAYHPGEFADMERRLLETLGWRLCGPTAAGFAARLASLVGDGGERGRCCSREEENGGATTTKTTTSRNARIVLMEAARDASASAAADYSLVAMMPSVVGAAAVLNAMDDMDFEILPEKERAELLRRMEEATGRDMSSTEVAEVRARLLGSDDGGARVGGATEGSRPRPSSEVPHQPQSPSSKPRGCSPSSGVAAAQQVAAVAETPGRDASPVCVSRFAASRDDDGDNDGDNDDDDDDDDDIEVALSECEAVTTGGDVSSRSSFSASFCAALSQTFKIGTALMAVQ